MENLAIGFEPAKFTNLEKALLFARTDSKESHEARFVIKDIEDEVYFVDDKTSLRTYEELVTTFDEGKRVDD